jgi:protein SCO1/2
MKTRQCHFIAITLVMLVGVFALLTSSTVSAQGHVPPIAPGTIRYDQNVNAQLPLDVELVDETGKTTTLRQYFGTKPVILIFAYYNCPMLCTLALSDLAQNLKMMEGSAGKEFEVLTVSFNARETPQMASVKKAVYLRIYDRPGVAVGWHFLVGKQPAIDRLTQVAGFHYQYDPVSREYAHPTGVIVLTPEGKIERYIFGIDYNATDLRLALLDATDRKMAGPIDQIFLLCYHYDPVTGQYTLAIENILRVAGLVTVLLLAGLILRLNMRAGKQSN